MRIVHWDEMFHPSFGYQINVLAKYQARQGHEVIIVTSDKIEEHPTFKSFSNNTDISKEDQKYSEKYGVKIIRLPIHKVISGRVIYKNGYINKLISIKPDVILCHTNDTVSAMSIARNYKKIGIPIVFDNHMLEMAAKNPFRNLFRMYFRKTITPLIIRNNWTVIRTQDDDYVNKHLGIPVEQTPFISFGSDTTLFYPDDNVKLLNRSILGIANEDFVIVYTGKINEAKGGQLLAEAFLEKFNVNKNIVLLVVGNASGEYGEKVDKLFKKSKNKVIRVPTQKYTDLPRYYQMSDLCVFPKQASLSFYDAQACGLPVISEDNNVNIGRLEKNNGFNFVANDVFDFRSKISKCVNMDEEKYNEMKKSSQKYITENFDYKDVAKQYTALLIREWENFYNEKYEG